MFHCVMTAATPALSGNDFPLASKNNIRLCLAAAAQNAHGDAAARGAGALKDLTEFLVQSAPLICCNTVKSTSFVGFLTAC